MRPQFDLFDLFEPNDYVFIQYFFKIQKRFPSLSWDDVIRKGLEEWDKIVQMDEEADREEKMRE